LSNRINTLHIRKQAAISPALAFTVLFVCVASLATVRTASASPAVATDDPSPASAPDNSNEVETPVSGSQVDGTSGEQVNPAPVAPAPKNTTLVADNQSIGNSTSIATDTAYVPTTTSGGGPLVGAGSAPPEPVVVGYDTPRLPFRFSVSLDNIYDDNIYIRHDNRIGDFYWTVTPGIEYKSRDIDPDIDSLDTKPENYFHVSYKPEFGEFLDQTNNNFIDQHATANYLLTMPRLRLGVDAGYDTSHYPNIDFGGRLKATYYTSRIYWQYALDNRLSLGGDVAMVLSRYDRGIDTDDWTTTAYLDYELTAKIKLGLGTTLGHVDVADFEPGQNYEQFYARSSYQIRDKISLTGQVGAELRQYDTGASTTNPSYGVGITYRPFDSTTLQLQGRRRTVASISQSFADYNDTDVALILRQRLLHKVFLGLKASYEHDDYFLVSTGGSTGLTYNYYTIRPSVEWDWNKYLTFIAYYEYQENDSSTPINGFYDNSTGIGAKFSF
jgi:hypothetical protein